MASLQMRPVSIERPGQLAALVIWVMVVFLVVPPDLKYVGNAMEEFTVSSGSPTGPIILLSTLLISLLLVVSRLSLTTQLLRMMNPFMLAFIGLATLSMFWSAEPAATARRLFRLYAIMFSCLALVIWGWQPRRFQDVLRPIITLCLLSSLIFGLVSPEMAMEKALSAELVGAWRGITMQKNSLGSLAATGVVLWLHGWLANEARTRNVVIGLAISVSCLFLSRSSTALLATFMSVPFMLLLLRSRPSFKPYMPYIVGVFSGVILAYSLAVLRLVPYLGILLMPITAITGKDLSFSGRTLIWDIIIESIHRRPLLGTGFGAYWTGPVPSSLSYDFVWRTYVYPTQSHNGYLDVINELGYVGGICLIGYLIVFLRQSLAVLRTDRYQGALFLVLLFQAFLANLSESHWFSVSNFNFLFMTLATASMARQLLQNQFTAARQPAAAKSARAHTPRMIAPRRPFG